MIPRAPKHRLLVVLVACVFAPMAYGGCTLPSPPSKVPSGAASSDTEMRIAMQTLKRFDVDVTVYNKCVGFEVKQGRLTIEQGARLQNMALEKLEKATKLFNEQMRIFMGH